MAHDDWRIRIELPDERGARGLHERLAVSQDGNTVFVYAASGMQAEQASRIVEKELADQGLAPTRFVTERWLGEEDRWDDEPRQPDIEEELLQRGYAPWEVRVECETLDEAHD